MILICAWALWLDHSETSAWSDWCQKYFWAISLFSLPPPCKFISCFSPHFLHAYFMFIKKKKRTKPTKTSSTNHFHKFPNRKKVLMFVQSLLHSKGIKELLNSLLQRLLVLENSYWKRNIQNLCTALRWSCVLNIVIG